MTQRCSRTTAWSQGKSAFRANRLAELERERERRAKAAEPAMAAASPGMPGPSMAGAATPPAPGAQAAKPKPAEPSVEQKLFRAEVAARFARLASAENALAERLTLFWSNHFAVSIARERPARHGRPFEREAIRP